jgi:hypothetical protein
VEGLRRTLIRFSISIKEKECGIVTGYNDVEKVRKNVYGIKSFNCQTEKLNEREMMSDIVTRLKLLRRSSNQDIILQYQGCVIDDVPASPRSLSEEIPEEGNELSRDDQIF